MDHEQAIALNEHGKAMIRQGDSDAATAAFVGAVALDPHFAEAHNNLANMHKRQGQIAASLAGYASALALRPDYVEAHVNLANTFAGVGRQQDAIAAYQRALALRPSFAPAAQGLATILMTLCGAAQHHHQAGDDSAAADACRQVLAVAPNHAEALNLLGVIACQNNHPETGALLIRQAVASNGQVANYHANLAGALTQAGRFEDAVACCRRALALAPAHAGALNTLGATLSVLGQHTAAAGPLRQAIGVEPGHAEAHFNLACVLLAQGDMSAGWREYEWRWQSGYFRNHLREFAQPQWHGEPAVGRTLLIHAEQGVGDTLQFCRYAPLVAKSGLHVILEVPAPLVRLVQSLAGVDRVIARNDPLPPFDLHCPMLSLPLAMGTTLETIPGDVPYLHPEAGLVVDWRGRLDAMSGSVPRVGLVWAGSPALPGMDSRRSLAPQALAPLFTVPGLQFFSLQKDGPAAPVDFPLVDVMAEVKDYADTAALVANLDLVISVDTSVLHLAGAMGKPVWLLDRFGPCWRWMLGRQDTPWYPGLRIFRQPLAGDWATVLADVCAELRQWRDGNRPGV